MQSKVKNNILLAILLITIGNYSLMAKSGKFTGTIKYEIEYDLPEIMESQRAMLPTVMITYIGKKFTRVEQKTGMGDQVTINNLKTKEVVSLINLMGQKIALKHDSEKETTLPAIEELPETKMIAGYECKKANITIAGTDDAEDAVFSVFYSDKIPPSANTQFPGLKGFPLQYTIEAQGMIMTFTAQEVKKTKVAKKLSKVPDGYEEMTTSEFMKMMGGM